MIFFQIISIIIAMLLISHGVTLAQVKSTSIINDPSISSRCKILIKKRDTLNKHKQSIFSLMSRNRNLRDKTPPNKKSVISKLKKNLKSLIYEAKLVRMKIQKTEKDIVRKGCPGIYIN